MYLQFACIFLFFFFFNDTATTEIYTLSLHDALPILPAVGHGARSARAAPDYRRAATGHGGPGDPRGVRLRRGRRSEEHTSELQSQSNLVCRLLLEKKNKEYSLLNLPVNASVSCPRSS